MDAGRRALAGLVALALLVAGGTVALDAGAAATTTAATAKPVLSTRWTASALPLGARLGVTGSVTGLPVRTRVLVERASGSRWVVVKTLRTNHQHRYATSVTTRTTRGWSTYRVVVPSSGSRPALGSPHLRLDSYSRHTYVVRTKGDVVVPVSDFAAAAATIYADPRGWRAAHHRFVRVTEGGAFTLVISQARYLPSFSSVCSVRYSCRAGRYVVINQDRWRGGSAPFTGTLTDYRRMVLLHETGHWLGLGHASCPRHDTRAPVMQQQSKGLQGCRPNPWPLPGELRAVA
ncbi:hypothetical protein GCM10027446_15320 [Angustibacter peucedani]